MPPPIIKREKEFGEIVRNEVDYPYQEDGYRILDKEFFYKQMKSDPSQLSLGGNDDIQYSINNFILQLSKAISVSLLTR